MHGIVHCRRWEGGAQRPMSSDSRPGAPYASMDGQRGAAAVRGRQARTTARTVYARLEGA